VGCYLLEGRGASVAAEDDDSVGLALADEETFSAPAVVVSEGRRLNIPACGPLVV
jgi:hypothetical protein